MQLFLYKILVFLPFFFVQRQFLIIHKAVVSVKLLGLTMKLNATMIVSIASSSVWSLFLLQKVLDESSVLSGLAVTQSFKQPSLRFFRQKLLKCDVGSSKDRNDLFFPRFLIIFFLAPFPHLLAFSYMSCVFCRRCSVCIYTSRYRRVQSTVLSMSLNVDPSSV